MKTDRVSVVRDATLCTICLAACSTLPLDFASKIIQECNTETAAELWLIISNGNSLLVLVYLTLLILVIYLIVLHVS